MKEQSENRRTRMTKRLMKDALLELLAQTELSGISVTAICERADVNRSTFYRYYTGPSDLLRELEQDMLDRIPAPSLPVNRREEESVLRAAAAFFDFVEENADVFRILFSESANAGFSSRMVDLLCAQHITGVESADGLNTEYMQRYVANGTVGMLREWIDAGFPISSREIAELMYRLSRKVTG